MGAAQAAYQQRRKAAGKCSRCLLSLPAPGRRLCPECAGKHAAAYADRRARNSAAGRCITCVSPAAPGRKRCETCLAKAREGVIRIRAAQARKRLLPPPLGFHAAAVLETRLMAFYRAYMASCKRCGGALYQDGLTLDIGCISCGAVALYGPVKPEERRFEPPLDSQGRRLRGAAAA